MKLRRLVLVSLPLVLSSPGFAHADPLDVLKNLKVLAGTVNNVVADGVGPSTVEVRWSPSTTAPDVVQYRIEVGAEDDGDYQPVQWALPCSGKSCVAFVSLGSVADPAVQWMRVVPVIAAGDDTGVHAGGSTLPGAVVVEGRPSQPDPFVLGPLPPADLRCNGSASGCAGPSDPTLTWIDRIDETYFAVFRAQIGFAFTGRGYRWLPAGTESWTDLFRGSNIYRYRVVAVRSTLIGDRWEDSTSDYGDPSQVTASP